MVAARKSLALSAALRQDEDPRHGTMLFVPFGGNGDQLTIGVAVVLVNFLGPYTYPVRREIEPLLVRQPAIP